MSRIERALEEAVRLRQPLAGADAPRQPLPWDGDATQGGTRFTAHPSIVALGDPAGVVAEQYRKLKSMIIRLTKRDAFRNVLMVTSSLSSEGKSVTCVNLALMLAQEYNHTVLLVDADLRRPSLHQYLGIEPGAGLADVLLGACDLSAAIVPTGMPKLSFLASGSAVRNPAELLSSQAMKDLLRELKQRYRDRYVLIDTPPALPFAETHAVSMLADGVVFVVKEGAASMNNIREALEIMAEAHLLGLVYNDASEENLLGRYHAYYYSSYRNRTKAG